MDFDYLLIQDKFERIIQENHDMQRFIRIQTEILQAVEILDPSA